ncbi:hypothetical protein BP6252_12821 [Coleophoma cylindrospora]|uniref:Alpha-ketoglutarate-dependent dioxygenase AlkB-like domain-containing protein n=1 Tax=Coleophoma cylindrospora TaxID=1849047 RepID=A0A3D8QE79_9HELO|nr:hypothetical protein BP6252_12821 [Coleophoma cylindrospora]
MSDFPTSKKRKRISDFFMPRPQPTSSNQEAKIENGQIQDPNPDLSLLITTVSKVSQHGERATSVPGLTIIPNFITREEEEALLNFLEDAERCTWRTDLSRKCMHFGGTYCLFTPSPRPTNPQQCKPNPTALTNPSPTSAPPKPTLHTAPPIPREFSPLLSRFTAQSIFPPGKAPQYCIVNSYTDAQGISAHVENYAFGEPVVAVSLRGGVSMRFHELAPAPAGEARVEKSVRMDASVRSGKAAKVPRTGKVRDVWVPARSCVVMRRESRWRWQHEILRTSAGRGVGWRRVSLTFRWKDEGGNDG